MSNNASLSGNTISDTYPSVLQLYFDGNSTAVIKDGYGNNSCITVTALSSLSSNTKGSIRINGIKYPTSCTNGYALMGDKDNQLYFGSNLSTNSSGDVFIQGFNIPSDSVSDAQLILFNNDSKTLNTDISISEIKDVILSCIPEGKDTSFNNDGGNIVRVWACLNSNGSIEVGKNSSSTTTRKYENGSSTPCINVFSFDPDDGKYLKITNATVYQYEYLS